MAMPDVTEVTPVASLRRAKHRPTSWERPVLKGFSSDIGQVGAPHVSAWPALRRAIRGGSDDGLKRRTVSPDERLREG